MAINQGEQPKRVIKGRKLRETGARESVGFGAGSTNFERGEFQLRTNSKKKLDRCLQRFFKFHIHTSRPIRYTFMVSKRKMLFHALLCYAFFIENAISNPITVFGIHIGLQRFLEFTGLGNVFAVEELPMSPDSSGALLAKRNFLISRTLSFPLFFF